MSTFDWNNREKALERLQQEEPHLPFCVIKQSYDTYIWLESLDKQKKKRILHDFQQNKLKILANEKGKKREKIKKNVEEKLKERIKEIDE